ncbi:succinate dehydrogenase iron-sulfur subunit [Poriferisphaera sp. WC338]|uniref:succinate dehydrogenase iron-sulfur subunit n=1 Tax=Poriferisphaera sp. WC338 TaxID=3425129 RepID=UPI003D81C1FE
MIATDTKTFKVKIKRQDDANSSPYWESFNVERRPNMNVISMLQKIAANPVTTSGKEVAPVVWDCGCLEEVCGACTMVINGIVCQSCSTLVDDLLKENSTIVVEPMSKFPVVRDLWVDRSRMFNNLKRIKGWVPTDGTYDLGAGPQESQEAQEERYAYSRCMTCGCCLEACPQFTKDNNFMGAQIFAQVDYFNAHATGKLLADERLDVVMQEGGISDCGNSQNCVKVCPKELPLLNAIAKVGRQTTIHAIKQFFTGKK